MSITWDFLRDATELLLWAADWLILQGPATLIFEGDTLVLHCRAWQDWPLTQVIFYREGSALGPPGPKSEFSITMVQKSDGGHYHCSGIFRSPGPGSRETASPVAITVQGESLKECCYGRFGCEGRERPEPSRSMVSDVHRSRAWIVFSSLCLEGKEAGREGRKE